MRFQSNIVVCGIAAGLMLAAAISAGHALPASAHAADSAASPSAALPPVRAARFTADGRLQMPDNLDQWVFLGASLGMGYSQVNFNPDTPGNFQAVLMEPAAYRAFVETGRFADGSMFALVFYSAERQVSINRAGFVMDAMQMVEIHLKDRARFPQSGFNFYAFLPGEDSAPAQDLPNDCVTCHTRNGAYDGVFTQFYPVIRERANAAAGRAQAATPAH